jgi:hypothetical protein
MEAAIIQQKIFEMRGERIMLDYDIAVLYGVETKRLNEQVKRNIERFPVDFMFRLTEKEWALIQAQPHFHLSPMRSQIATASVQKRNHQHLPYAFTEHGITMLASVLRSEQAVQANLLIVRAFIAMRQLSVHYRELAEKLAQLENTNNSKFREIYQVLNMLIGKKEQEVDFHQRRRIGFKP